METTANVTKSSLNFRAPLSGQIPGYHEFFLMVVYGKGVGKGSSATGCPGRIVPVLGVLGKEQRTEHGCGALKGKQATVCSVLGSQDIL